MAGSARPRSSWWIRWAVSSLCAAAAATAADAALLQRARSYFTGGFLAVDSIRSAADAAGFVAGSLLADFAVLGVVAGMVLWAAGRAGVRPRVAIPIAVMVALVPWALADIANYELATYLGDAFDLRLMFDLAGRDFREFLAVSSAHVSTIAFVGIPLFALGCWLTFFVARRFSTGVAWPGQPRIRVTAAIFVLMVLTGAAGTTGLRRSSDVLDNGIRRKPTGQWLELLVNRISDVDRDGYGLLGRPPDPNLFDKRVRPYAREIPGNGVDEDGVAGDLPAGLPPYHEASGEPPVWQQHPDVVLIVLESFRADAVGASLHGKPVTPVINDLARRGVSAASAYSHNGYTVQARHHIFSGSVADVRGGTSLIDDFKANGYQTAYFSGQDESFGGAAYGVGFDRADVSYDARADREKRYSTFSTAGSLAVPNGVLLSRVSDFLDRRSNTKPLFLYVNFHDTHFPYHHAGIDPIVNSTPLAEKDITPGHLDALRATYLNTAANVDRAIGRVLEKARDRLGHEPGVIVVSDHGESLFDEGFLGHGYALNEVQTRIPLVVANLPVVLTEPVGQADLRDALRTALEQPAGDPTPRILQSESRRVFQYLGTFARPAEIAFTGLHHQIVFDFRIDRVRIDRGAWVAPRSLSPADAAAWRELVTTWERMRLATNQGPPPQ